ncbi:beta-N-acetylhexosaminidase [Microbacterium sp. C7(2022)]|uniref:beta-N-acetylhexosaminidase n=1 Tax=Microbacterium sp. C7(2022) TaxID=2992759 RepID=UPI00237A2B41|nr:beta-N-acetylhexosaminidase [Microbacterium sp. C7(2022)]MDE0547511.1 beta-N-acetylhexosaminidase [Microbacterium sp. C7(2022)]
MSASITPETLALVPVPAALEVTGGTGFAVTSATTVSGPTDATTAALSAIATRTGVTPVVADGDAALTLAITPGGAPESYRLEAASDSIRIVAADAAGLFYGVQTLAQLLTRTGDGWHVPAVIIDDAPRFAYRGVMLDVARHFHPVATVKAYIDRAASLKFNALHLHLTDDQGWRIELHSRPELTARASGTSVGGDPGGFYTKADYREIVEYAASRHMIVVPEIDMPGHTHAVGLAYPELIEEPVLSDHIHEVVKTYGGELPRNGTPYDGMAVGFSSLKIHSEATYDFVADVFGELAGETPGPYLHLGGDEALGTDPADFAAFVSRASAIIADLGKTPVAWHEAGAAAGLHDETIGQYWGFVTPTDGMDDKARAFVRAGAQLILSPADAIYLDMKPDADSPLGLVWANGPTSVERSYAWEPSDVIGGITDADILGIEAPLWTETVATARDIDQLAFPRIASAAEAGWSPATGAHPERTWESFRARVAGLGPLWARMGVQFDASSEIDWVTE